HDCRIRIGEIEQDVAGIHYADRPAAGRVVRYGVLADRDGISDDENIGAPKIDVDVAVSVRARQVPELDVLARKGHFAGCVEGFRRQRFGRTWPVVAILPLDVKLTAEPQLRVLVSEDRRAAAA